MASESVQQVILGWLLDYEHQVNGITDQIVMTASGLVSDDLAAVDDLIERLEL